MRVRGRCFLIVAAPPSCVPAPARSATPAGVPSTSRSAACGAPPTPRRRLPTVPDHLTVATFNMLHGLTAEGDRTLEGRLAIDVDELAAAKVDVVGIQEAEESTKHGRVIARLAERTGAQRRTALVLVLVPHRAAPTGTPDTRPGGGTAVSDLLAEALQRQRAQVVRRRRSPVPLADRRERRAPAARRRHSPAADDRLQAAEVRRRPDLRPDLVLEPRAALWTRLDAVRRGVVHERAHLRQRRAARRSGALGPRAVAGPRPLGVPRLRLQLDA